MNEYVLVESSRLRQELCTDENTSVLDRIGELITLPGTGWATTEQVAKFYKVTIKAVKSIVTRHRKELEKDGYKVLSRKDFGGLQIESLQSQSRFIAIFPRKAVLRVGMLLARSEVAKQVRTYLLNTEERALASQDKLLQMADQLTQHAIQLSQNATQIADNANQLVAQSRIISAITTEIYMTKENMKKIEMQCSNLCNRLESIENSDSRTITAKETINARQIEILKNRVKKIGKPITVWKKFNRHFGINRYINLPTNEFEEALLWLDDYDVW